MRNALRIMEHLLSERGHLIRFSWSLNQPMKSIAGCLVSVLGLAACLACASCAAGRSGRAAGVVVHVASPMAPPRWAVLERQLLADNAPPAASSSTSISTAAATCRRSCAGAPTTAPTMRSRTSTAGPSCTRSARATTSCRCTSRATRGCSSSTPRRRTTDVPIARAGHVLQGIHRPVRLDAPRRGAAAVQPHGPVDPDRREVPGNARGGSPGSTWARIPRRPTTTPAHKIIRSMQNGSRGPMLRKATALDWVGDPFDVNGLRRAARRVDVRAVPRPLRGIRRRRRRSLPQPGRDDAADQRVSARRRAEVQDSGSSSTWTPGSIA